MGYESLHITELLSVQCLQVDDVIPILSPAVYCGFELSSSSSCQLGPPGRLPSPFSTRHRVHATEQAVLRLKLLATQVPCLPAPDYGV